MNTGIVSLPKFICTTLKNNRTGGFITSRGYRQSKAGVAWSEDLRSARIPIAARVRTDFFVLGFGKDGCREHFLNDGLDLSDHSGLAPHKIIKKSLVVLTFCTDCFAQFFYAPFRPGRFLFQEVQIVLSPSSGLNGFPVDFTVLEIVCDAVARAPFQMAVRVLVKTYHFTRLEQS